MIETILEHVAAAQPAAGPKYRVLRNAIVEAISTGKWVAGMQLPTEAELAKTVPYSLGTVQKAYALLVRDGLIVRTRGRGSFVAPLHRQMAEPWHCRFLGDDGTVLPIYPRLLGHAVAARERRWVELFGPRARIVRIDRAISINDEFDVISRFFVPRGIAKPLLVLPRKNVETANFKAVILRELGVPISRIMQTIATPDAQAWRAAGLLPPAHLVLEATAYTAEGEVVYFQEIYIPPNRRKLLFESDLHQR